MFEKWRATWKYSPAKSYNISGQQRSWPLTMLGPKGHTPLCHLVVRPAFAGHFACHTQSEKGEIVQSRSCQVHSFILSSPSSSSPLVQICIPLFDIFSSTIMFLIGSFTISSALSKTNIDKFRIIRVLAMVASQVLLAFVGVIYFASVWIRWVSSLLCFPFPCRNDVLQSLHPISPHLISLCTDCTLTFFSFLHIYLASSNIAAPRLFYCFEYSAALPTYPRSAQTMESLGN